jgi:hypothetical protein
MNWIEGWVGPRPGLDVMAKKKIPSMSLLGITPWSSSIYTHSSETEKDAHHLSRNIERTRNKVK